MVRCNNHAGSAPMLHLQTPSAAAAPAATDLRRPCLGGAGGPHRLCGQLRPAAPVGCAGCHHRVHRPRHRRWGLRADALRGQLVRRLPPHRRQQPAAAQLSGTPGPGCTPTRLGQAPARLGRQRGPCLPACQPPASKKSWTIFRESEAISYIQEKHHYGPPQLVFSDEFAEDGRSLAVEAADPRWTSERMWYAGTEDMEVYVPDQVRAWVHPGRQRLGNTPRQTRHHACLRCVALCRRRPELHAFGLPLRPQVTTADGAAVITMERGQDWGPVQRDNGAARSVRNRRPLPGRRGAARVLRRAGRRPEDGAKGQQTACGAAQPRGGKRTRVRYRWRLQPSRLRPAAAHR